MFLGSGNCGIAWKRLRHRNASSNETEHEESTRFLTAHGGIWVSSFFRKGRQFNVEATCVPWNAAQPRGLQSECMKLSYTSVIL